MVYIPKHVTCFLKLAQQEEELRLEEEKFYEAKREAARIAKLQKAKEKRAKTSAPSGSKSWLGENEKDWDVWGSYISQFNDDLFVFRTILTSV